ncbi:AAA family ATPase [Gluconacetobacter azotocaptans]|uniref:DNA 5'-3' helicase n=1 Tax=Gluconacetobacter azotocaptans TaxID=142834 RepID=A0A7W4PD08_9PROT|nr:DnaB-like helicase C-terminal domain-containing protein [Gluconacetobacter azotocaptans]MBB2189195.1 AAA family ATPase [Gluconacetobacter azotocaptans]GBQ32213.1 prophage replicative DNA helicase DnaB [Gluconacetobacter azotocaptans DSM 13594]
MNHIPEKVRSPWGAALRERPSNVAAEQALIGALLVNSAKAVPLVEEIIEPEHFYVPLYGEMYAAIRRLVQAGRVADPTVISPIFRHHDALDGDDIGKVMGELMMAFVGWPTVPAYATAVREAWLMRALFDLCTEATDLCCRPGEQTAEDIRDQVETGLLRIAQGCGESDPLVPLDEAIGTAVANAREAAQREDGISGVTWGYKALDRMTAGLHRGDLTLLGARPAMGKTALGLGIAARAAAAGNRVLFWSGEMRAEQLGARAGAAWAGLSTLSVFTGRRWDIPEDIVSGRREELADYQWRDLEDGQRAAASLPLVIDHRAGITVAQLRARARRMARQKQGLDLIVADYIALIRGSDALRRGANLNEILSEVSLDLKNLASELHIPVLSLSQLSRESAKRDDKTPRLDDLRDSGALEQNAATVIFLHREHYYLSKIADDGEIPRRVNESRADWEARCARIVEMTRESKGKADIIIGKNRHGPTGACRMQFDDNTTWFRDLGEDPRSPAWIMTGPEF